MMHKRKTKEEEDKAVSRVCMDYHYMSKKDKDAEKNPVLIMVNEKTGEKDCRLVRRKGLADDESMDWLPKDMSDEWKS